MTVTIFLVSLMGAMAIGVPIAFSLIICGIALMAYLGIYDSQIVAQKILDGADNFPLLAIPFFLLAGELMNAGGLSKRIVNFALALIGHRHGGLGYVAIVAAIIMASLSGSAAADTAALAAILIPMMREAGYNIPRSAGLIAAGGIVAPVIPPSIGFVVFGVAANVSIPRAVRRRHRSRRAAGPVAVRSPGGGCRARKSLTTLPQAQLDASAAHAARRRVRAGDAGDHRAGLDPLRLVTPTEAARGRRRLRGVRRHVRLQGTQARRSSTRRARRRQDDGGGDVPGRGLRYLVVADHRGQHPRRARQPARAAASPTRRC